MTWIIRNHIRHVCAKPYTTDVGPGSVWVCDQCGTGWKAVRSVLNDPRTTGYWQKMFGWRTKQIVRRERLKNGAI